MSVMTQRASVLADREAAGKSARLEADHSGSEGPGVLDAFQGIATGVITGGLLWLGLVWFVFSLLRIARLS